MGNSPSIDSPRHSFEAEPVSKAKKHDEGHPEIWLGALSDFHNAQCFYSIALQIASFVAIYGGNKNREDDIFLLLISADGLLPVALVQYTLQLFGPQHSYHLVLTVISTLLASITGFSIIVSFSDVEAAYGGDWPSTCGGISPQGICGAQLGFSYEDYPNFYLAAVAAACDAVVIACVIWYILTRAKDSTFSVTMKRVFSGNRIVHRLKCTILHTSAVLILLACSAIELYFFYVLLSGPSIMDAHDWSFGQIVGITIWFAIITDLMRHEAGM